MEDEPRYYVRHQRADGIVGGGPGPFVSFIRDRWYCHRDAAAIYMRYDRWGWGLESTRGMQKRAEALCAEWNAEHEAWIQLGLDVKGPRT